MTRIVGIVLVRDEDLFVEQAVRNISDFCDELLLVDHRSRDGTPEILRALADELPQATYHPIRHGRESHDLVKGYAGEDVWVFAADGDELYDPAGLPEVRSRLVAGEFDRWWQVRSNFLHCTHLDRDEQRATGYLCPPAPNGTKLFNFAILHSWDAGNPQRLHGPGMVFKPGYGPQKLMLHDSYTWEESPLRCLHVCWVRRSSLEKEPFPRRNITDRDMPRRLPLRLAAGVLERIGRREPSAWKDVYRVGEPVEVSAAPFFPAVEAGEAPRRSERARHPSASA